MREERSREKERGATAVREKGKRKRLVNLVERDGEREREGMRSHNECKVLLNRA